MNTISFRKMIIGLVIIFFVMPLLPSPHELKGADQIVEQPGITTPQPERVLVSEKLNSNDYGPAYIESMDVAVARDHIQRFQLDGHLKEGKRNHGIWVVPPEEACFFPHSGKHNLVNKWGDTKMGITFPTAVDIQGAWIAGQGGGAGVWAKSLRVIGFHIGEMTQTTDWFDNIGPSPTWFAINLRNVDRIVIEATPGSNGAGWYAIDDFTYTPKMINGQQHALSVVLDFENCPVDENLNDSHYAGLTWETGTGGVYQDQSTTRVSPISSSSNPKELSVKEGYGISQGKNSRSTPTLISDYQGVIRGDATSWSYPPDSCGAAGPRHFVEVVNRNFAVYNKSTGQELINILLGSFLPGSNGDPRVLYDQHSGRWFVTVCDFTTQIYLAVSLSDDPTGSWFKSSFVVSQGSDAGKWPDYPTLGVDEVGVYSAAYMVGGSTMSVFALDKAPLIDPNPHIGNIFAFRNLPWEGAIQPVHTFGMPPGEYFVSRASSTSLRVRLLTGLPSPPVLDEKGFVTVPSNSEPPDAPALGSTTPLDTVDSRLMNAIYRDGFIWTAHCINVGGRAASRWYKINVANITLADHGTIEDPVMYYFFPTIMVNANGDAIMGFSGSSPSQYGAAYYTGRLASDPPGQMAPPVLLKAGEATYNLIDGYGRNRWGDYSLCSLDPVNLTFWTIQEYAHSHNATGVNRWGTWIGELSFNRPPEIPSIYGPAQGIIGVEYTFTAVTSDPNGDQIFYKFDWGDGNLSEWLGPYNSGQAGLASHIWGEKGQYHVRVKAKDIYDGESGWSPDHNITILTGSHLEIGMIQGGLGKVRTVITNNGSVDATHVNWTITLNGGAFMGKVSKGTGLTIPAGGKQTVSSKFIFGLGATMITVKAEGAGGISATRNQSGFVFFFFVKVNPGG